MAVFKNSQKDNLPSKIYLDSAFLVDSLIETKDNIFKHKKAVSFAERLQKSNTTIICSKLCYIEYWNAVFGIKCREVCGNKKIVNILNSQKETEVFDWVKEKFNNLIMFFELLTKREKLKIEESIGIIEIPKDLDNNARETAVEYRLPIYDAIHYYTMLNTNTKDIITDNIDDFKHLKNITIWKYR